MQKQQDFKPLAMPLSGGLDTRSRPADLIPGSFRFKLNLATNKVGKLCRRAGYGALSFGQRSDSETAVNNWDYHRVGGTRKPILMQLDSTGPDSVHRLFVGTEERLAVLDNDTSEWTAIKTGLTGGRPKGATLGDTAYFTNNVDEPQKHVLGSGSTSAIAELQAIPLTKAKVIIAFSGVVILMNVEEGTNRLSTRIRWSNFKDGTQWDTGLPGTAAGFLDLPYGDDILNAINFNGEIWIFTTSSIWKLFIQVGQDKIFGVKQIYSEPKNRTGCLAYENTLTSTGKELVWAGRDTIYSLDQYRVAPTPDEWTLKASGRMFEGDHAIDVRCCQSAVAEFEPNTKEIWLSYAQKSSAKDDEVTCLNDFTIVLIKNDELAAPVRTADYVDAGFSALSNFARKADTGEECNSATVFIGASTRDYCLKSIGTVFRREVVALVDADPENDISDDAYAVEIEGYTSRLVGTCPFGYPKYDKVLRALMLEHDTVPQTTPNVMTLRIGNSWNLADPMDERPSCSVLWNVVGDFDLSCPEPNTIAKLQAANQRPSVDTEWKVFQQGKFLYFDIILKSPSGGLPIGSDAAFHAITFEVLLIGK